MTLFRQLSLILLILLAFALCGTLLIGVDYAKRHLAEDLGERAQDTALALALAQPTGVTAIDRANLDPILDALFQRGYFQALELTDANGGKLASRALDGRVADVPLWFVKLLPLQTLTINAEVIRNGTSLGTLELTSNAEYAYYRLWNSVMGVARWVPICALLVMALGAGLLGFLLSPLRALERQAEAICNRRYPIQERLPRTRELRRLVQAMNRVASRVRQIFDEHAEITQSLRAQIYVDTVTGLGNRRYFDVQMEQLREHWEDAGTSALLMLELAGFKQYNVSAGYPAGDGLLLTAADMIRQAVDGIEGAVLARLNGATFAILAPRSSVEEIDELARRLSGGLEQIQLPGFPVGDGAGHIGGALLYPESDASRLVSNADQALRTAQLSGTNAWHIHETGTPACLPMDLPGWRAFLEDVIDKRRFLLHFQPVLALSENRDVFHQEALLRVRCESGKLMPAGVFLPMAERLGLGREIDKACIALLLGHLKTKPGSCARYAVNLACSSLGDSDFVNWLADTLTARPDLASRLIFEISEDGAVNNLDRIRAFLERITPLGAAFCLDHVGRNFTSFAYLHTLSVDFLKIDSGFLHHIEADKDNQQLVLALTSAAHDLEIKVIAKNVENPQERQLLAALHVDGIQGYLTGGPVADEDTDL